MIFERKYKELEVTVSTVNVKFITYCCLSVILAAGKEAH